MEDKNFLALTATFELILKAPVCSVFPHISHDPCPSQITPFKNEKTFPYLGSVVVDTSLLGAEKRYFPWEVLGVEGSQEHDSRLCVSAGWAVWCFQQPSLCPRIRALPGEHPAQDRIWPTARWGSARLQHMGWKFNQPLLQLMSETEAG